MAGVNPDDFPGRWITITEAIGIFGVSERTIRRRIAAGQLPTKHESGRVLIYLYETPPGKGQAGAAGTVGGVTELQTEVRHLQDLLSQVESERDHLRSALATCLQTQQKLIEARPYFEAPRRWWEFWKD